MHVLCISKSTLWLCSLLHYWEKGSGVITTSVASIWVTQKKYIWGTKESSTAWRLIWQTFANQLLFYKVQHGCSVRMSGQLASQRKFSVSTFQTPLILYCSVSPTMFRIKLCIANAFAQCLSLAHGLSPTFLHPTISSLQTDPFFVCMRIETRWMPRPEPSR